MTSLRVIYTFSTPLFLGAESNWGVCVCVVYLEYVYVAAGCPVKKMAAFVVLAPLLNFRIFTREAKGGGGVNYRYISTAWSAHRREAKKKKKTFQKGKNSMANCRGET